MQHRIPRSVILLALFLITGAVVAVGAGQAGGDGLVASHEKVDRRADDTMLLAVDAGSATAAPRRSAWRITLADVNPQTVSMDDHPGRDANVVATGAVVSQWRELGFAIDPPNAFLSGANLGPVPVEIVNRPAYDHGAGTMSFDVVLLGAFSGTELPSTFDHAVLVIDSIASVDSDLLDLTTADVPLSGTVGATDYTITSVPSGNLVTGEALSGPDCALPLACQQSGVSPADDQTAILITFSAAVDVNTVFLLDFFSGFDGTFGQVTIFHDGGSVTLSSDPSATPGFTSGSLLAPVLLEDVTFLEFMGAGLVDTGEGQFAVAGIELSTG